MCNMLNLTLGRIILWDSVYNLINVTEFFIYPVLSPCYKCKKMVSVEYK